MSSKLNYLNVVPLVLWVAISGLWELLLAVIWGAIISVCELGIVIFFLISAPFAGWLFEKESEASNR